MRKLLLALCLLTAIHSYADEGMWMPGRLNNQTRLLMQELGLELPAGAIYSEDRPSMKDAIVNFGGFCSGVVVSNEGLVFTNHHCGFTAIQQHSTVENNYLKDGFVAWSKEEELPNPGLYVSFLVRTEDVSARILEAANATTGEEGRIAAVDSMIIQMQNECYEADSLLRYIITPNYWGSEYHLSVYKDYNDVRLVYAPPSSVGKFGGDTDNWVWPRHTGDFAVFRIYADKENQPAYYEATNVPYRPEYVIPISTDGYKQGSYCMTMGYPGTTDRYLSSFGVRNRMETENEAMIHVRGIKQKIWKEAMETSESGRIMYASKYASSANYWKNSIGMNRSIQAHRVIEKKEALEQQLKKWIRENPEERNKYLHVLTNLELNYRNAYTPLRAMNFFMETFLNSSELLLLSIRILNFDTEAEAEQLNTAIDELHRAYEDFDPSIDKKVFVAVLEAYRNQVDSIYLPALYDTIRSQYRGDIQAYADALYANTQMTTTKGFETMLQNDPNYSLLDDPAINIALELLVALYDFNAKTEGFLSAIEQNERLLTEAIRQMYEDQNFYPDANSTMRLSIGIIDGYRPKDGVKYAHYTTTKGIFEKVRQHAGDTDFAVQPELLELLSQREFGQYADSTGEMNVCFISNNDITGGNSGSGMFDSKGRLIGLAFDGNWEAMSSDLLFEPTYQRCIGVDIRYALYLIEHYSGAKHLTKELMGKE